MSAWRGKDGQETDAKGQSQEDRNQRNCVSRLAESVEVFVTVFVYVLVLVVVVVVVVVFVVVVVVGSGSN